MVKKKKEKNEDSFDDDEWVLFAILSAYILFSFSDDIGLMIVLWGLMGLSFRVAKRIFNNK